MTACGRSYVLLAAAIAMEAAGDRAIAGLRAPDAHRADRPALTVVLYNYASVPADVVSGGKATVSRLYQQAGVDTVWIDARVDAACASFNPRASHETFIVQMVVRPRFPQPALGYVRGRVRETTGEMSGLAYLSFDQITQVARDRAQQPGDVFGYAMAHEIAHVLLPSVAHARHGLMREHWGDDDFKHMAAGYLRFTPAEEALIRARVDGTDRRITRGTGVAGVGDVTRTSDRTSDGCARDPAR